MRIDRRKKIREVAGEHIIIMQGAGGADMTKIVALNESGAWLYGQMIGRDFTVADAAAALMERYEVDAETARHDADEWLAVMKREGVVVDE